MLYWLDSIGAFGVSLFGYLTFRMFIAVLVAFAISMAICLLLVKRARKKNLFEDQSEHEDPEHIKKLVAEGKIPKPEAKDTKVATMGGVGIVGGIMAAVVIAADLSNPYVLGSILLMIGMGSIGFFDDYRKMRTKKGISSILKLSLGFIAASGVLAFLYSAIGPTKELTTVWLPFNKDLFFHLGMFYAIFFTVMICGFSNAVNVTDGIDGLAGGLVFIGMIAMSVIAYIVARKDFTEYLYITHVPGAGEMSVVLCGVAGAVLGFLWFNAKPASIYMGDTGSLALGGLFGYAGLVTKQESLVIIIGAIFVIELLSVAIQIAVFHIGKARYFPIAPIHIVFERNGWDRNHIVTRAYILGIFLAFAALGSLKMR